MKANVLKKDINSRASVAPAIFHMKIMFNAREVEVKGDAIPYSTLCNMADLEPFFCPTVTYKVRGKDIGGSIIDGTYLEPQEGMIINVMMTNNA